MRVRALGGLLGGAALMVSGCALSVSGGVTPTRAVVVQPVAYGGYPFVVVSYDVTCPSGEQFRMQVDLTESGATGTSRTAPVLQGVCSGQLQKVADIVRPVTGVLHTGAATVVTHFAHAHTAPRLTGAGVASALVLQQG